MFPNRCRVTGRRDFDNQSTGRHEAVAILRIATLCRRAHPTRARLTSKEAHRLSRQHPTVLDAACSEFHSLILAEASAANAFLAFKIDSFTLASSSSSGRIQSHEKIY